MFVGITDAGVDCVLVHQGHPFMCLGRLVVADSSTAMGRGRAITRFLGALGCQLGVRFGGRLPVLQVGAPFDQLLGPSGRAVLRFL